MTVSPSTPPPFDTAQALRLARETFEIEAAALTGLAARVDERFAQVNERFAQVDERFDQVDKRLTGLDERCDRLERLIVESKEETMRHFDVVSEQIQSMIQLLVEEIRGYRSQDLARRVDRLEKQALATDKRLTRLEIG